MLVLYVDDFLMSGPKSAIGTMWEKIGTALKIDEPGPMGLYLGCIHEEGMLTLPCGREIRYCTFNSDHGVLAQFLLRRYLSRAIS